MSIQLIVNADDYGHTPGVSAGIRDSHLRGIVTSTTAMMNMPAVEVALQQAMRECPLLGLGVHLVLTTGAPVLNHKYVSSLLGTEHCFPGVREMISRLSSLDLAQVRAEWHTQVEKFVAVTGHTPDHLDSHHHISYLSTGLFRIMVELAIIYDCAIRFPVGESAVDMLSDFPSNYIQDCLESNSKLVSEFQISHPDHFIKSFYGEKSTRNVLYGLLAGLPDGITEIMCHPGYADRELMDNSIYHLQREVEISILTDPGVLEFIKERNIELINLGAL